MGEHLVHKVLGQRAVAAGVEQNAVLGVLIDLNNGMSAGAVYGPNISGVNSILPAHVQKHLPVVPNESRVADLHARPSGGHGLVQALAAGKGLPPGGPLGLALPGHMVDLIDVVHVQGTDI